MSKRTVTIAGSVVGALVLPVSVFAFASNGGDEPGPEPSSAASSAFTPGEGRLDAKPLGERPGEREPYADADGWVAVDQPADAPSASVTPKPTAPAVVKPTESAPAVTKDVPKPERTVERRVDPPKTVTLAPKVETLKVKPPRVVKPAAVKPVVIPAPVVKTEPPKPAATPKPAPAVDAALEGRVDKLEQLTDDLDKRVSVMEDKADVQPPASVAAPAPASQSETAAPEVEADEAKPDADVKAGCECPAGEQPKQDEAKPDAKPDANPDAEPSGQETVDPKPDEAKPSDQAKPEEAKPETDAKPGPVAKPAAPSAAKAGEIVFPKTGKPSDPGDKRVISPNPSPIVDPATLKGPKIVVKKGDDLGAVFSKPLTAGTVVELPRGAVFTKPIVITGQGTKDQPVLVTAAPGTGALPTWTPAEIGNKDAAVVTTRGSNVQLNELRIAGGVPKLGFDMGAKDGGANRIETDGSVNAVWIRDGEQGGTGNGSWVWDSLFENGRMQVGMDGPEDDYGAAGVSIQADGVKAEGITGRNLHASSPDYDQYGGDGALFEVWMKGDGLKVAHSSVKNTARVLEAGGLKPGTANVLVEGVYADGLKDAAFHFQEGGGPYGALKTNMTEKDNNIAAKG